MDLTPRFHVAVCVGLLLSSAVGAVAKPFELPPLPYPYEALEPAIDRATMEIHHSKHHKAYVDNLNQALGERAGTNLDSLLAAISKESLVVRNNAGGHWNHSFFWKNLRPARSKSLPPDLRKEIEKAFTSVEKFQEEFSLRATKVFGSGWAWLILNPQGELQITTTPNQDNPLMDVAEVKGQPLLGIDVWEHAYYLRYQSRRVDYLKEVWSVVDWDEVHRRLHAARKAAAGKK